ncbi:hypothetical protein FKM82_023677 [Ascaphus truei]
MSVVLVISDKQKWDIFSTSTAKCFQILVLTSVRMKPYVWSVCNVFLADWRNYTGPVVHGFRFHLVVWKGEKRFHLPQRKKSFLVNYGECR